MYCNVLSYNTHGLPWSKDESKNICHWILTFRPSIVCLQEVFCESAREYYNYHLSNNGYYVCIPNDKYVTFLTSGLLTAVLRSDYHLVSDIFCPFQSLNNVEWFALKGFHTLRLIQKSTNRKLCIVNTHTQSDNELYWLFKNSIKKARKQQFEQISSFFPSHDTTLVIGDLNCEHSPHPHVRFLYSHPPAELRKRTFYSTGEDLDHIAWLPLQWANPRCSFCDIDHKGPKLQSCQILQKPWSDHAPVYVTIYIPRKPTEYGNQSYITNK